jgi:hypothetical protein
MKMFIRKIGDHVTKGHLVEFVAQALRPIWILPLRETGQLTNCAILHIRDPESSTSDLHGLAEIDPESAAVHAVMRLNGRRLCGQVVEVRRWHERSAANDRRRSCEAYVPPPYRERRRSDRRRDNLQIRTV